MKPPEDTRRLAGIGLAPGYRPRHALIYLYAAFWTIGLLAFVSFFQAYLLNAHLALPAGIQGRTVSALNFANELLALCLVYLLTTLGLGLFVSTVSSTQQQAMITTVFFFMLPMLFLSGFVFPIENMPDVIQPITYLIPLRYFLEILRSLFLKGVGLEVLWPQALALLAWGCAILTLAVLRSTKRIA